MMFELVRLGWPNAVTVLALAAVPFISLALPAGNPPISTQVASVHIDDRQAIGIADIRAE
jgi:hypothetical protein